MSTMEDTVAAVSTPPGKGGIAVVRISGPDAISVVDSAWHGKSLNDAMSHTAHLGKYVDLDGNVLDEALATVFRNPASFTGEDVVELSIHGSRWIQREVLHDLIRRGIRTALPGEFTRRAFQNGKIDLAQAEGVADLIDSSSRASHRLALSQTKGVFSKALNELRDKLIDFASLLELELDFAEEDVEFADRGNLFRLATDLSVRVKTLAESYSSGSVIKSGIPVVIAGIPNVGKSSLLNLLLGDDKAIVSDIPGTTRDVIEDTIESGGMLFRFIDTAGLRETTDAIESLGIGRARTKMREARIIIWMIDPTSAMDPQVREFLKIRSDNLSAQVIPLINKSDLCTPAYVAGFAEDMINQVSSQDLATGMKDGDNCRRHGKGEKHVMVPEDQSTSIDGMRSEEDTGKFPMERVGNMSSIMTCSVKTGAGMDELKATLHKMSGIGEENGEDIIVTNARHYEALNKASRGLEAVLAGLQTGLSADFIAQDIREVLHHIGEITGTVTSDTLLHTIFSRFCIGK